jgi:hypothetical protein
VPITGAPYFQHRWAGRSRSALIVGDGLQRNLQSSSALTEPSVTVMFGFSRSE